MKTWKATGCVLLAGIFWGSMGLFVRQLNAAGLYAIDVMQLRVLASAIFVGLYLLLFDRQKLRLRPRDIWCFAGSGICSLMLFSWCYFTGMQAASLAVMAVLLYTAPVFVMLMSIVFFREKLTGAKLTALVLCLAGCVLVSGVGSSERLGLRGLLLGLGAGGFGPGCGGAQLLIARLPLRKALQLGIQLGKLRAAGFSLVPLRIQSGGLGSQLGGFGLGFIQTAQQFGTVLGGFHRGGLRFNAGIKGIQLLGLLRRQGGVRFDHLSGPVQRGGGTVGVTAVLRIGKFAGVGAAGGRL